MARTYVEKARKVNADQFLVSVVPWPPGVSAAGSGYVYTFPSGITLPIVDTDWITVDTRSGQHELVTDAAFQDRYGAGPPAVDVG